MSKEHNWVIRRLISFFDKPYQLREAAGIRVMMDMECPLLPES